MSKMDEPTRKFEVAKNTLKSPLPAKPLTKSPFTKYYRFVGRYSNPTDIQMACLTKFKSNPAVTFLVVG